MSTNHAIVKIVESIFQQTIFGVGHCRTQVNRISFQPNIRQKWEEQMPTMLGQIPEGVLQEVKKSRIIYSFYLQGVQEKKLLFIFFLTILNTTMWTLSYLWSPWTLLEPFTLLDTSTRWDTFGHLDPFGHPDKSTNNHAVPIWSDLHAWTTYDWTWVRKSIIEEERGPYSPMVKFISWTFFMDLFQYAGWWNQYLLVITKKQTQTNKQTKGKQTKKNHLSWHTC